MCKFKVLKVEELGRVNLVNVPNNVLMLKSDLGTFRLVNGLTPSEVEEAESDSSQLGQHIASLMDKHKVIVTSSAILDLLPQGKTQYVNPNSKNGLLLWKEV